MNLTDHIMRDARSVGNPCIRCGSVGTTCGRHYNGLRQHQYGKGRGIKCHPFLVADLCAACDALFQEGSAAKDDLAARIEYSEEFQHWCLMTLIRREQRDSLWPVPLSKSEQAGLSSSRCTSG